MFRCTKMSSGWYALKLEDNSDILEDSQNIPYFVQSGEVVVYVEELEQLLLLDLPFRLEEAN